MKDKPFIYQDNRALHERRMKERTRTAISKRNIEFILAHQSILDRTSDLIHKVILEMLHRRFRLLCRPFPVLI